MTDTSEELRHFFQSLGIFSPEEIDRALALFTPRTLPKSAFFIREGERCSEVAFIRSGIFRSFYLTDKGEEMTYCFRFPNELLAAYSSFITGNGSQENMQAISPAELLVIRKDDLDALIRSSHNWTLFLKMHAELEYVELEKRLFQLQRENAAGRYRSLLTDQPEYIRQIPLQYLASYLGITQRHLSRVRREIVF